MFGYYLVSTNVFLLVLYWAVCSRYIRVKCNNCIVYRVLKKLKVSRHLFIVLVAMRYWDLVYSCTVFLPICRWIHIHFVNIRGWPLERYHGNFLHKSIWVSHHFYFWVVCHNICLKMTTPSNIATVQHWCKVFQIWHRHCSCYGVSGWRIWF